MNEPNTTAVKKKNKFAEVWKRLCKNTGAVTAALDQSCAADVSFGAGGIIGVSSLGIASDCVNSAPISATVNCKRISGTVAQFDLLAQAGGIIGWWATPNSGKDLPLTDCENTGAITASDTTMSRKNLPTACSDCWKPERLRSPSVGSFVGSGANWLFSHSVMRTVA